ncbi:MAG: FtsX-like permease family protein, partial [Flavisolibacter sp.]|nr:FtsX-like permease family protein [Flavisolibacter sp.]
NTVRIKRTYQPVVRVNNQSFVEDGDHVASVDKSFFSVFSFPLKEGNPATVLADHKGAILSERAAIKYFGHTDPIGKVLLLPNEDSASFMVSGIAKDFPSHSSFQFDIILPREAQPGYEEKIRNGLNTSSDLLVIQLKERTNAKAFEQKLDAFGRKYFQPLLETLASIPGNRKKPEDFHLSIRHFAEAHYNRSEGWPHFTDLKNIYQLISLSIVILFIACLNYVLLTLTNTISRSQEVGIRKTMGAPKKQIIFQFYTETQLLAFLGVLIGFVLAVLLLPLFSRLINADIQLAYFSMKQIVASLVVFALALGILAGIYPALVMSGLRPLNMMRKFSAYRLNPALSRAFVVVQFSACIILIVSSLVIKQQMQYINKRSLGFDKDQIVAIQNPYGFNDIASAYQLKERLYHYAATEPAIQDITSSFFPFQGYNNVNNHIINGEGTMVQAFDVDYNYFSFYKIPILKGRPFSPFYAEDSARINIPAAQLIPNSSAARQAVVVNETLYQMLSRPALDEFNRAIGGKIIGVCKDYHSDNLTKKIGPVYHRIARNYFGYFCIKIKAKQSIPQTMEKIMSAWKQLTASQPFSYKFLDEEVAKSYDTYLRWMQTITACFLLAIIIACLGLFGLSGITTINRTKEIGIRKVLGATIRDLFLLLNKGTAVMAVISFIMAVPIAIYLTHEWLENFAYRVNIDWTVYVLSGIISLVTAIMAVSYHTIKTAKANPVKSLRTE